MNKKISRRSFIRSAAHVAGGVSLIGLTGCIDVTDNPSETSLNSITDGSQFFPQSVASGDPKADSIILWTRVEDTGVESDVLPTRLQIATDDSFTNVVADQLMGAINEYDGGVKLRVAGLSADTTYYYRFLYDKDSVFYSSRTGRTKTAPDANSTRDIKFAYTSCQDYVGRYFNTYLKLLDEDLDFIVHLGDYIYETTGDPAFQTGNSERQITFTDQAGAIQLGEGDNTYYSAASLDNYRQIYKTVRSDEVIQQLHERFPMIAIWDDHEFSDDSHGSTSTMTAGREDEENTSRKQNAEQAFFEYMPVDALTEGDAYLHVVPSQLYPNTRIYRDFVFGQNLHLVMTDYRTNRPDHLIPEDGFPGTIVLPRAQLTVALATQGIPYEAVAASFTPYINIDDEAFAVYKPALIGTLTQAYMAEGLGEADASAKATGVISGNLAAEAVNGLLAQYNAAVPVEQQVPLIADEVIAASDTGIAYLTMGKTQLFSSLGSRYFVVKDVYDLYAGYTYAVFSSTQDAYGPAQENWYQQTLLSSSARWKVIASSVSHTSLVLDLTDPNLGVPEPFNQKFYLNVDHWDGFGNKRDELIQQTLANVPGSVIIAGDIHASFVTDHGQGTHEFTNTSVSSGVFRDLLASTAASDPLLSSIPGIDVLIASADILLQSANPAINYANTNVNGVAVVTASSDGMQVDMYEAAKESVFENHYDNAAEFVAGMTTRSFQVNENGELVVS